MYASTYACMLTCRHVSLYNHECMYVFRRTCVRISLSMHRVTITRGFSYMYVYMGACMYRQVFMYIHYIYIYMHACMCLLACKLAPVHMQLSAHVSLHACMQARKEGSKHEYIHVCMQVCMHVCRYVCMYLR